MEETDGNRARQEAHHGREQYQSPIVLSRQAAYDPVHAFCLRPNAKTGLLQIATKKANDIARLANLARRPFEFYRNGRETVRGLSGPIGNGPC